MLHCEDARSLIGRSVDGTITPRALDTLNAHLLTCPACREEAETQHEIHQLLASRELEPLPSGFAERLSARLANERPLILQSGSWFDRANWRKWSIYLLPAAAVLVIFATRATLRDARNLRRAAAAQELATSGGSNDVAGADAGAAAAGSGGHTGGSNASQESVLEWLARPDTTDDSVLVLLVTGGAPAHAATPSTSSPRTPRKN